MRRVFATIVAALLSFTLMTGAMAHATEPGICLNSETAKILGHTDGDRDEVPFDAGKTTPHHHGGCVGHQLGEPAKEEPIALPILRSSRPSIAKSNDLASMVPDTALRPPRA